MSQEQSEITFPVTRIMVGKDGVLIETFLSHKTSIRQVLDEKEVNDLLKVWLANRKQLESQIQFVKDVMKNSQLH